MRDALTALVPLFAFMLLPVWIPMIAVAIGWVGDQVGGRGHDEVVARLAAAKERTQAHRAQHAAPARSLGAVPEAA